jgi:hypothetical protein
MRTSCALSVDRCWTVKRMLAIVKLKLTVANKYFLKNHSAAICLMLYPAILLVNEIYT